MRGRNTRRLQRRCLPGIEQLEDRRLLAWVTVGNGGTHASLNDALADVEGVPGGSTITLLPGTYSAAPTLQNFFQRLYLIDRPLTLQASDPDPAKTVLDAPGNDAIVKITSDDVTLVGLTIRGGTWITVNAQGSAGDPLTGVTLDTVTVSPISGTGVNFESVDGAVLKNARLGRTTTSSVYLNNARNASIIGNVITGSTHENGITLNTGSTGNLLRGNTIGASALQGIILTGGSTGNVIDTNTITGAKVSGVYLDGRSTDNTVTRNAIQSTGFNGIAVTEGCGPSVISGNTVTAAGSNGILIDAATGVVVEGNTITAAGGSGIYLNGAGAAAVATNAVAAAGENGITLNGGAIGNRLWNNAIDAAASHGIILTGRSRENVVDANTLTLPTVSGIYLDDASHTNTVADNQVINSGRDGIVLAAGSSRNDVVGNTITDAGNKAAAGGNGILLSDGADFNWIAGNTIVRPDTTGVYVTRASSDNQIVLNTVIDSVRENGVVLNFASNRNLVARNTIRQAWFDGILVSASSLNRIEHNEIDAPGIDGVTLDKGATFNVVAGNSVHYADRPGRNGDGKIGAGLWINDHSDANWIYANRSDGAAENGIAVFRSSHNVIEANETTRNNNNGIYLTQKIGTSPEDPTGAGDDDPRNSPRGNVVVANFSHEDVNNGYLLARGTTDTEFSRNFTFGAGSGSTAGFQVDQGADDTRMIANIFKDMGGTSNIHRDTTRTLIARNRAIGNPVAYSKKPATVAWDAGATFGGNFFSDHIGVTGNPSSGGSSYDRFIWDDGKFDAAPYVDRHPFASESLGMTGDVTILEPLGGGTVAPGSARTIGWLAPGAIFVEIALEGPAGTTVIEANAPNTGARPWVVPTDLPEGAYALTVSPRDSRGNPAGLAGTSAAFTVAGTADRFVRLLSPSRASVAASGSTFRVAWEARGVGAVHVDLQTDGGGWQRLASDAVGGRVDVALPEVVGADARIRITDVASSASDTTDGAFAIQGTTGGFVAEPTGTVAVGSLQPLRWRSPSGTRTVSLEYADDQGWQKVFTGLADTRGYVWIVPDARAPAGSLRLTFQDGAGAVLGTATSGTFTVPGSGVVPLFNAGTYDTTPPTAEPPASPTAPDLVGTLTARLLRGVAAGKPGTAALVVRNAGPGDARGPLDAEVFLVRAGAAPGDSNRVASVPARTVTIKAGRTVRLSAPFRYPLVDDGTYTLMARFNTGGALAERDHGNNSVAGPSTTLARPRIDLQVTAFVPPVSIASGAVRFSVTVRNAGTVPVKTQGTFRLLHSTDAVLGDDLILLAQSRSLALKANTSRTFKITGKIGSNALVVAGFLGVALDTVTVPQDSAVDNNVRFASTPVPVS